MAAMDRKLMNTTYMQAQLKRLHTLHKRTMADYSELMACLNEECEILVDLIPSYKISPNKKVGEEGEEAKTVKHKKEVAVVEKLEHELLTQYEHFLQLLRKLSQKNHPEQQALGSRLCARLVRAASDFNHQGTMLELAVDFANAKSSRVAAPCLEALQELLDNELVSEPALCVVSSVLVIVRKKHHALNPKVLNLLLYIRVAMLDMHRKDITEEKEKNKRMKKADKELARQMMKAKARRDRSELATKQAQIVEKIFIVYLRVLKGAMHCNTQQHQTRILAPTLEGLAKFAPLVNVEHYHQLIDALREIIDSDETSVTTKLHGLVAIACLSQKDCTLDSSEWRVDQSHYHNILFKALPDAMACPSGGGKPVEEEAEAADDTKSQGSVGSVGTLSSQAFSIAASMAQQGLVKSNAAREWTYQVGVAVKAIDLLILTQRHVPVSRIIALTRRLVQYIPHTPPNIAMSLCALCHRLVLRYPGAASVFLGGADHQFTGRGNFNPECDDINNSNAEGSFAWELPLLANSFHPKAKDLSELMRRHYAKVAKTSQGAPAVVNSTLNRVNPVDVLEQYDTSLGDVRPNPPLPASRRGKRPRDVQQP